MLNRPHSNRELDLKQYIPIYMRDEQIDVFFDVFEEALNNLYEAGKNETDYDNVVTNKKLADVIIEDDTANNLFKYPVNPIDPDNVNDVVDYPDWPYDEHHPSQNQLNPIPNTAGLNPPPPYPDDIPDDDYLNVTPPASHELEVKWPVEGAGPFTMVQGFDFRDPIEVQATSVNENNQRGAQSDYEKQGLYQYERLFQGDARPIPKFTKYTTSKQVNHTQHDRIGVLEKIYRLIDLKDASMIDMKYLQFFADYLGYDLNLNLDDFGVNLVNVRYGQYYTELEKEENIEKQVRTMVENLPYWYKIKTTEDALKIILYSFGLIADILTYYTKNYSTSRQDWETADKKTVEKRYKSWSDDRLITIEDFTGSVEEGRPEIPDDWYPTPHFEVRYSINNSFDYEKGSLFIDETAFAMLSKAIDAAKPINTVFEGLAALFQTRDKRMITAYTIVSEVFYQEGIATEECGWDISDPENPIATDWCLMPVASPYPDAPKFDVNWVTVPSDIVINDGDIITIDASALVTEQTP